MIGELDKFGVCSADISELGSSELGEIGLNSQHFRIRYISQSSIRT